MLKNLRINALNTIFIILYLSVCIVCAGNMNITSAIYLTFFVLSVTIFGALLLSFSELYTPFISITHSFLSFFIGSLFFSSLVLLRLGSPLYYLLIIILSTSALLFFSKKKIIFSFKTEKISLFVFVIASIITYSFSSDDLSKQMSAHQVGSFSFSQDYYFFNSIVATLRNGEINSAVYEVNTPLRYQLLGFFQPALFAKLLSISSNQALWGLASPLYKILTLLLCNELFYSFFKEKINRDNYLFTLSSMLLPVLLAPLHPLYLIKGQPKNFIFNGMSYLMPNGTITYPITMFLLVLCCYIFFQINWVQKKITYDKVVFIILSSLMAIGKTPLFVNYGLFLFAIILYRIIYKKGNILSYLPYFLTTLLLSYELINIFLGHSGNVKTYFKFGHLLDIFAGWYHLNTIGTKNEIILFAIIIFTYLLWLGARLVGLVNLKGKYLELVIGGVFVLIVSSIMNMTLQLLIKDPSGKIYDDKTFDLEQFIRSAFYILTIVSCIGIFNFFIYYDKNKLIKNITFVFISIWCITSYISLLANEKWKSKNISSIPWYQENYDQLKTGKYDDGLIIIDPHTKYYGIMLSSSDLGKYWTALDVSNYNGSFINSYRWKIYDSLLQHPTREILLKMKQENVKYIIANPTDIDKITLLTTLFPDMVNKVNGTNWIFKIN